MQEVSFTSNLFGDLTVITIKGAPWFIAKEVAEKLKYQNPRTMTRRLDDDEKGVQSLHTLGGNQEVIIINESGLYNAIFGSKLDKAKEFKKWVTSEVLPSIRKTGKFELSRLKLELRQESGEAFKLMNDALKREYELIEKTPSKNSYMKYAKLIGLCITGKYAGFGDWDAASESQLKLRSALEVFIHNLFNEGVTNYHEIKSKALVFAENFRKRII